MSEYIFDVPDENQPIAGETSVYYPDERDEPMIVREEIVRCRDCIHYDDLSNSCLRRFMNFSVEPDGFCNFGRKF